jgi:hypothetical protein
MTKIKEMSRFENFPSYLFINGYANQDGDKSGNGYYCPEVEKKKEEEEESSKTQDLDTVTVQGGSSRKSPQKKTWIWLSPVQSKQDDRAVYTNRYDSKSYVIDETTLPVSEGEPPYPGPANCVVTMTSITNLHSAYDAQVEVYVVFEREAREFQSYLSLQHTFRCQKYSNNNSLCLF